MDTRISSFDTQLELEQVADSLDAVSQLMMPAEDLTHVSRDKIATLLCYLTKKLIQLQT